MYGWPPTGPGPALKRAGRCYVREIGVEHPLVEDFVSAARRHIKDKEKKCIEELEPLEKQILTLRGLAEGDPAPPKLMQDAYRLQLNEKALEAVQLLGVWKKDIGADSDVYLRFMRSTLGHMKFAEHCCAQASEVADELRAMGPRPAPGLEENDITEARCVGATSLAHYLEAIEAECLPETSKKGFIKTIENPFFVFSDKAFQLREEFGSELKRAEESVEIFKDREEQVDGGWHIPPGFEEVEQKPAPAKPPPKPKRLTPRLDRELPGMKPETGFTMQLHGVGFEDVQRHSSELLLLEMAADIIAEECKIPRDCIFNIAFNHKKTDDSPSRAAQSAAPEDDSPSRADMGSTWASSTWGSQMTGDAPAEDAEDAEEGEDPSELAGGASFEDSFANPMLSQSIVSQSSAS